MTDDLKTERGEWGVSAEIEPGLHRIRLKNDVGSLMVNTYVYHREGVFAVFDPGWPWTLDALEESFSSMQFGTFGDVTHWVYTHTHIDHMGAAAILEERSDAPHLTLSSVSPLLNEWHAFQDRMGNWTAWTKEAIADQSIVEWYRTSKKKSATLRGMVSNYGDLKVTRGEFFDVGDELTIGDLNLHVIDAKGHDPHHVVFLDKNKRWLFGGDVVLSTPTPIVRAMNDDLVEYKKSLDRLSSLDVELLLPGHGMHRTGKFEQSVQRSKDHVQDFHDRIVAALRSMPSATGLLPIATTVFPDLLEQHQTQLVVNLALIDSHLRAMVADGEVEMFEGPRYKIS